MLEARVIAFDSPSLVAALEAADLSTEDLDGEARAFFELADNGKTVGFGGFELYGPDALLRSVVVLPEVRGKGYGRAVSEKVLDMARGAGARHAYLLTTTAVEFFEHTGLARIERQRDPATILATKGHHHLLNRDPACARPRSE